MKKVIFCLSFAVLTAFMAVCGFAAPAFAEVSSSSEVTLAQCGGNQLLYNKLCQIAGSESLNRDSLKDVECLDLMYLQISDIGFLNCFNLSNVKVVNLAFNNINITASLQERSLIDFLKANSNVEKVLMMGNDSRLVYSTKSFLKDRPKDQKPDSDCNFTYNDIYYNKASGKVFWGVQNAYSQKIALIANANDQLFLPPTISDGGGVSEQINALICPPNSYELHDIDEISSTPSFMGVGVAKIVYDIKHETTRNLLGINPITNTYYLATTHEFLDVYPIEEKYYLATTINFETQYSSEQNYFDFEQNEDYKTGKKNLIDLFTVKVDGGATVDHVERYITAKWSAPKKSGQVSEMQVEFYAVNDDLNQSILLGKSKIYVNYKDNMWSNIIYYALAGVGGLFVLVVIGVVISKKKRKQYR